MGMTLRQLRILSILAIATIAGALTSKPAEACVCGQPESAAQAHLLADAVVVAEAESVARVRKNHVGVPQGTSAGYPRAGTFQGTPAPPLTAFTVTAVFKGPSMRRVESKGDGTNCDVGFKIGETYLIYAGMLDGVLSVSKCDRILPLSEAAADLQYLEGVRDDRPRAIVSGWVHVKTLGPDGKPRISMPEEPIDVIATGGSQSYKTQTNPSGRFELVVPPNSS